MTSLQLAMHAASLISTRRPFPSNDNSTSSYVDRSTYFGYKYMSSVDDCLFFQSCSNSRGRSLGFGWKHRSCLELKND